MDSGSDEISARGSLLFSDFSGFRCFPETKLLKPRARRRWKRHGGLTGGIGGRTLTVVTVSGTTAATSRVDADDVALVVVSGAS